MPQESVLNLVAEILRLMGEPTRLKILLACLDKPMSVTELSERFKLSMPLTSHHIGLLKAMQLIQAERQGKQVFYHLKDEHVRCILADLLNHFGEEALCQTVHLKDPSE